MDFYVGCVARDQLHGISYIELVKQEAEFFFQAPANGTSHIFCQPPEVCFKRAKPLLARLIYKLLFCLALLVFFGMGSFYMIVNALAKFVGEHLIYDILKPRGQMHLSCLVLHKLVECLVRERGCTMLDRTGHAVSHAAHS